MAVSAPIATITVRNLDGRVKERLRVRATQNGRSMEAEARLILSNALTPELGESSNLAAAIRRHVAPLGSLDLAERSAITIGDLPSLGRSPPTSPSFWD